MNVNKYTRNNDVADKFIYELYTQFDDADREMIKKYELRKQTIFCTILCLK